MCLVCVCLHIQCIRSLYAFCIHFVGCQIITAGQHQLCICLEMTINTTTETESSCVQAPASLSAQKSRGLFRRGLGDGGSELCPLCPCGWRGQGFLALPLGRRGRLGPRSWCPRGTRQVFLVPASPWQRESRAGWKGGMWATEEICPPALGPGQPWDLAELPLPSLAMTCHSPLEAGWETDATEYNNTTSQLKKRRLLSEIVTSL